MTEWAWHDRAWREHVDDSVDATFREALGRAIDIRDLGLPGNEGRPVFLVDVLNHLSELLAVDTASLWDRT